MQIIEPEQYLAGKILKPNGWEAFLKNWAPCFRISMSEPKGDIVDVEIKRIYKRIWSDIKQSHYFERCHAIKVTQFKIDYNSKL